MACTSDTFCAKLVRATLVKVLSKCKPMIVYKKEKLPHLFEYINSIINFTSALLSTNNNVFTEAWFSFL